MVAVIEARGLVKRYGQLAAVDGVDLAVEQGSFLGILGPNGAGKTTLLEMIEGIRRPDAGEARVFGEPTWPRHVELLARIGVQLQSSAFFERLTAREQLQTVAALYGTPTHRADELLEVIGLTDKAATRVEDLSGGQVQRLSIACALVHQPEVVFLDEPTAALDPQSRRNLWDVLRGIQGEGRTVVLTTHHMDEAESLCDEVAIIDHGKILTRDAPAALVAGLDAPTRISVRRGALDEAGAGTLPNVERVEADAETTTLWSRRPEATLGALAERGALDGLAVRGATLDDVFLALTGREYRS